MAQPPDPVDVKAILEVAQFITAVLVVPGGFALIRRLSDIRDHLAKINGRLEKHDQWVTDHDARVKDMEKHHEVMHEQCAAVHQERMNNLTLQCDQLWGRIGDRRQGRRATD